MARLILYIWCVKLENGQDMLIKTRKNQGMVNAYGVFNDFYVRSFLTTSTPSNIRFEGFPRLVLAGSLVFTCSWIGSTQIFLQFALGMPMGKLFDDGAPKDALAASQNHH